MKDLMILTFLVLGLSACEFKKLEPGLENEILDSTSVIVSSEDCLAPWGDTIKNGDVVEAWKGFGIEAESEIRSCKSGTLSGTFAFPRKIDRHPLAGSNCNYRNGGPVREEVIGSSCAQFKASVQAGGGGCLGNEGGELAKDSSGNDLCQELVDRDRPTKKCFVLACSQPASKGKVTPEGKCSFSRPNSESFVDQPLDCQGDDNSNCNPSDTVQLKYSKPVEVYYPQNACRT